MFKISIFKLKTGVYHIIKNKLIININNSIIHNYKPVKQNFLSDKKELLKEVKNIIINIQK